MTTPEKSPESTEITLQASAPAVYQAPPLPNGRPIFPSDFKYLPDSPLPNGRPIAKVSFKVLEGTNLPNGRPVFKDSFEIAHMYFGRPVFKDTLQFLPETDLPNGRPIERSSLKGPERPMLIGSTTKSLPTG